jgi:large subunit ribosomal protein L4
MVTVAVKTLSGSDADSVELDEDTFGLVANIPLMHQVVNAQLAARRAGTHSTKTRKEVRGGGAKPWKQKGTGRARAGSTRSPIWIGGGIAHGPKPRDYSERTNKKMIKAALRCALSDRAADDKVLVVDSFNFDQPSTKQAKAALSALGVEGRALVVIGREDANAVKSFRNLPEVHVLATDQLNCYDVLVSDYVVFSKDSLPSTATGAEA